MKSEEKNTKDEEQTSQRDVAEEKLIFGLVAGLAYTLFGILQALVCVGVVEFPFVPGEPVGVLVLMILGAVFLSGYRELREGTDEGVAHIHVGLLLSLLFGVLYLLILGADALETYLLKSEDFAGWTPRDGMRPELYLALLSLMGIYIWRDEFSFKDFLHVGNERQKP